MKSKKKRNLILLLVVLLGITIGFALLSTTLYINGTSTIKGNTWNIHWDGDSIAETTGSVTATTPAAITDGTTAQNISFAAEFELPGDFYEFTVDAVNTGSIDGILKGVDVEILDAAGENPATLPSYIKYSVTYADGTTPAEDTDVLAKTNGRQGYKVKVWFDSEATSLPDEAEAYTFNITTNYEQYKAPAQNNNQP